MSIMETKNQTENQTTSNIDQLITTSYDFAVLLQSMYEKNFVCASIKHKSWYEFKDHRWIENDSAATLYSKISTELIEEYKKIYESVIEQETDQEQKISIMKLYASTIKKLKSTSFKKSIIEECQFLFYDKEFLNNLDENRNLICFNNGIYDLEKMIFRDGLPQDYISLCTNTDYKEYDSNDENIKSLNKYFEQVHPNENIRNYVLNLLSSYLSGHIADEKFIIWTGTGANSKSKLVELFSLCLGDYSGTLPISLLTQKRSKSGQATPEIAMSKGRRFMVFQEPESDSVIKVGLMKELTGGDTISARQLFKEPIEFKPQFKLLLTCNILPHIPANDGGTWRRLRVVEFKSKFCHNPKKENEFLIDYNLSNNFEIWKQSLMSLLIQKYKHYKRHGLEEPREVTKYTESYKASSDVYYEFIKESLKEDKNNKISIDQLYNIYKIYIKNNTSYKPANKKEFKKYFDDNYQEQVRGKFLYGFGFDEEEENQMSKDLD